MMSPIAKLYCALGYKCNNNCIICAVSAEKKQLENISTEEALAFFDRLDGKGITDIEFSGGEATIREDFLYLLNYIYQKYPNIKYTFLSNGRKYSDIDFVNALSKFPIRMAITAIHGATASEHDAITRVKGSFNQTVLGLKNLFEYNIPTTIKVIITRENYRKLPKIVEFIGSTFPLCNTITLNALDITGNALKNKDYFAIRMTETMPYVYQAIDKGNELGIRIKTYSIPRCLFKEDYQKYVGPQPNLIKLAKSPSHETNGFDENNKSKKCGLCRQYYSCSGTWQSYLQTFGDSEITPFGTPDNVLNITYNCNNKCIFCCEESEKKNPDVDDLTVFEHVMSSTSSAPPIISGGEPLLRENVFNIIQALSKKHKRITMMTNARRFKNKKFAKRAKESGLSEIIVALHSEQEELHDHMTGAKGSFSETCEGIKNVIDQNIEVSIKIIVTKQNYLYLDSLVKYIYAEFPKIKSIIFASLSITGAVLKNKDELMVNFSKSVPHIKRAASLAKKLNVAFQFHKIPLCVNGLSELMDPPLEKNRYIKINNKKCIVCKLNNICTGIWTNYTDIYGDEEISPL